MRELADKLWLVEQPFRKLGVRSTIVGLKDNVLWVHSPIRLSKEVQADLDRVGVVQHVVAPSRMHHLFISDYQTVYPGAQLYGVQKLVEKRREISFHAQLGAYSPASWGGLLDQQQMRGIPLLDEFVFLHKPSRTLIVTDLLMYFPMPVDALTKVFLWLDGIKRDCVVSRLVRLAVKDRGALRLSVNRVLDWDFDRIIMSHGQVIESGGKDVFRTAFDWLG